MLFSGDPKLDYVPQTLINWAIKSIVQTFLNQMKEKAEKQRDLKINDLKKLQQISELEQKLQVMLSKYPQFQQ